MFDVASGFAIHQGEHGGFLRDGLTTPRAAKPCTGSLLSGSVVPRSIALVHETEVS